MRANFSDGKPLNIGARIHQKRAHRRFPCDFACDVMIGNHSLPATARNISLGGVSIELEGDMALSTGVSVVIALAGYKPRFACVRWSEGSIYGLQFLGSAKNDPGFKDYIETLERSGE